MRFPTRTLLLAASIATASVIEQRAACNADNCLRALRSVGPKASDDCYYAIPSSVTFKKLISTTTSTIATKTLTSPVYSVVDGDILPSPTKPTQTIPSYAAAACGSGTRYVSACSCVRYTSPVASTTSTIGPFTTTVTVAATTVIARPTIPVCDPANNYGLVWKSGTVGGPLSTTDRAFNIDAAKTAKDCCINCYRTKYCSFFEYAAIPGLAPFCILNENLDGFVTNPVNPTCPYGDAQIDFESGADVLAFGPCAVQKNGPWSWS